VKDSCQILILGSGPTGLGAAYRLNKIQFNDYVVIDKSDLPGGLSVTKKDAQGFLWDMGGHVLFSHYKEFDEMLDETLGDEWQWHVRESWVWMRDRFVPYPLQHNSHMLPKTESLGCARDLTVRKLLSSTGGIWDHCPDKIKKLARPFFDLKKATDFENWLQSKFGQQLFESFLKPYNEKVWAQPLSKMNSVWVGERVALPNWESLLKGFLLGRSTETWGPNYQFRFPTFGGTGAIWQRLYESLPRDHFLFSKSILSVDANKKLVRLSDSSELKYDKLISTIALDDLLKLVAVGDRKIEGDRHVDLLYSSTSVLGIGLKGQPPAALKTKNWIYFPEEQFPFYRMTVFSNYSPYNVPLPGEHWSLLLEVASSEHRPKPTELMEKCVSSLENVGWLHSQNILSRAEYFLPKGYPTPFLERDNTLSEVQPWLESLDIFSRGRFGGWKYEVSNQDHSFMQGYEIADRLVSGQAEKTYRI